MEMMKAAVLKGEENIEVKEISVPELKDDSLEIKVSACGVCGSDIHMWKAGKGWAKDENSDFVMGHEFCGVVTNEGKSDFKKGDRVVFWANLYCGKCDMCQEGKEHLCRSVNGTNYIGFVCNGGYAEKFVGKYKNVYKLPDNVSDISATLIDSLMVAYHAVHNSKIKLNDKVLIVGSGIIGHLIGDLVKKAGASYVAISKVNDLKIKKAKELNLFDEYFDGNDPEIIEKMYDKTEGGFDIAFEAVGSSKTINTCIEAVKPGGKVIMIGNSIEPEIPVNINRAVLKEVKLIGSVSCTRKEFEETIDLISKGIVNPEQYVTDILPLSDLQKAFEKQANGNNDLLKAVIKMNL